jgi:glycosidase
MIGEMRKHQPNITIDTIPLSYWTDLVAKGYDSVWLLGVWNNEPAVLKGHKMASQYIHEYRSVLPDVVEEDIIDSCFAINDYSLHPMLGNLDALANLKKTLNSLGLRLILDFVPNHFHCYSEYVYTRPDMFIAESEEYFKQHSIDYYTPLDSDYRVAHGRDPYTGSWSDTAQIDWSSHTAREVMSGILENIAQVCDGVRCDMAMLIVPHIFNKVWGKHMRVNWWKNTIQNIKSSHPDFVFIAECYWNTKQQLLESGFDYAYDKELYDILVQQDTKKLSYYLKTNSAVNDSVIFLENHDENRSASIFSYEALTSASTLQYTLPGLQLIQEGQQEGWQTSLPVQIGRRPQEKTNTVLYNHYKKLQSITNDPVFVLGDIEFFDPIQINDHTPSFQNLIMFKRTYKTKTFIVIINFTPHNSKAFMPFTPEINEHLKTILFHDRLSDKEYAYARSLLLTHHLYIELKAWQSHIFEVIEVV